MAERGSSATTGNFKRISSKESGPSLEQITTEPVHSETFSTDNLNMDLLEQDLASADSSDIESSNEGSNRLKVKKTELVGVVSTVVDGDENSKQFGVNVVKVKPVLVKQEQSRVDSCQNKCQDHPTETRQNNVKELFVSNAAVFGSDAEVGTPSKIPHDVQLTDYTPFCQRSRRFTKTVRRQIKERYSDLEKAEDFLSSNSSGCSSLIVSKGSRGKSIDVCSLEQWGGISGNSISELRSLQRHKTIRSLINKVSTDERGAWPPPLRKFKRYAGSLYVQEGILYYDRGPSPVPVVPFPFLAEVALATHYQQGHPGRQKLLSAVGMQVWHPSLSSVVADICQSCEQCQRVKVAGVAQPPITRIKTTVPFEMCCVDLVSLPRTKSGNTGCLVTVDHYSKWLSVVPISNKTAAVVTKVMKDRVLPALLRPPDKILSDNGMEFKSSQFNQLLGEYGIKHIYTTAYKPSSNGLVERSNRTLIENLRSVGATASDWDTHVSKVVTLYNSSYHAELQESPCSRLLTRSHKLLVEGPMPDREKDHWREGNPSFRPFKRGHLVWRKVVFSGRNVTNKLADRYEGPYKVIIVNGNKVTYIVQDMETKRAHRVHHTQLRRYYSPPKYLLDHPSYKRLSTGDESYSGGGNTAGDEPTTDSGNEDCEGDLPSIAGVTFFSCDSEISTDTSLDSSWDSSSSDGDDEDEQSSTGSLASSVRSTTDTSEEETEITFPHISRKPKTVKSVKKCRLTDY